MIAYNGRLFRPVISEGDSDTSENTIFRYEQKDDLLTGTYSGGYIRYGHLIGHVDINGKIDMRYHHITYGGELMTGVCKSKPERLENGKLRLHETWQWTCKDRSKGTSILEEI